MQCLFVCFLEIISIYLTFYYEYDPGNGSRCNPGYLGPGGISDSSENYDCIGGAATAIDKLILGESRMYRWIGVQIQRVPFKTIFKTIFQITFRWTQARSIYYPEEFYFTNSGISFDPEGLLGTGFEMTTEILPCKTARFQIFHDESAILTLIRID